MIKERWAFSKSEHANPTTCLSYDELVASIDLDDDWGGVDCQDIIVYRNGYVTNRFADGTVGIPAELAELAEMAESLLHPDGEETSVWMDVEVDSKGNFIKFLN